MLVILCCLCFLISAATAQQYPAQSAAVQQAQPVSTVIVGPQATCPQHPQSALKAVAVINPDKGNVTGVLSFTQADPQSPVIITGRLEKLTPSGLHGFHVHTFGNLTQGCASSGSHFNPANVTHAGPTDTSRHVGDLGNIQADPNGNADISITDHIISLTGSCSIVGRAVVVHLKPDDLGKGGNTESLATGNAGARVGCGVIGLA